MFVDGRALFTDIFDVYTFSFIDLPSTKFKFIFISHKINYTNGCDVKLFIQNS